MAVFLIISSVVLWVAAIVMLPLRTLYAPALSYLGLLVISFAKSNGIPILPVNNVILTGWLCMTLVVMLATLMQPVAVRNERRGMGYIIIGAFMGMAVGLLGFTLSASLSILYGIMIVATAAGIFFGFMLYTKTPEGSGLDFSSGNFFRYLAAKGFPTAITVMQIGVVLVITLALYNTI